MDNPTVHHPLVDWLELRTAPSDLQPHIRHVSCIKFKDWTRGKFVHYRLPDTQSFICYSIRVDDAAPSSDLPLSGKLWIYGPRTVTAEIPCSRTSVMLAAHIHPACLGAIFRRSAGSLVDKYHLAMSRFNEQSVCASEQHLDYYRRNNICVVFNEFIKAVSSLLGNVDVDEDIVSAVDEIQRSSGQMRIASLAKRSALHQRTFLRKFVYNVGITPKLFSRIVRCWSMLSCAASASGSINWLDIALRYGYADQPHMVRDFVSLLGMPPMNFLRLSFTKDAVKYGAMMVHVDFVKELEHIMISKGKKNNFYSAIQSGTLR